MIAACTFGLLTGRPLAPPTTPDYVAEEDWTSRTFNEVFDSMVRVLESLPERAWSISYQRTRLLTPQEAQRLADRVGLAPRPEEAVQVGLRRPRP